MLQVAEVVMRLGEAGIGGERAFERGRGLLPVALFLERDGESVQGLGIIGVDLDARRKAASASAFSSLSCRTRPRP